MDDAAARELLHALANSLTSARTWLVVLENVPPQEDKADAMATLNRLLADAEDSCRRLRELLPPKP